MSQAENIKPDEIRCPTCDGLVAKPRELPAEAPELPWTNGFLTVSRSADSTYVVDVSLGTATNGLHRETARAMALALLKAAAS